MRAHRRGAGLLFGAAIAAAVTGLFSTACGTGSDGPAGTGGAAPPAAEAPAGAGSGAAADFALPRGLQGATLIVSADNPMTPGKIRLGEQLFFDKRLSREGTHSCESCHVPEKGWTDGLALSPKFDGSMNTRHSPTLYGAGFYPLLYWDGRAPSLEAQILAAWKGQMGADPDAIAARVDALPGYQSQFMAEFGGGATGDRIVQALASFVRTLHAGDTDWDRHPQDETGLASSDVGQGFKVFTEVAKCSLCHAPPAFTDFDFHNVGIGFDTEKPDLGRGKHLTDAAAKAGTPAPAEAAKLSGAFKTPTLRGIGLTGPYFHDGRAGTLEEAVDLMLKGGVPNPGLDEKLKPATLTAQQREQLLAFLRALTPRSVPYARPTLP